MQDLVQELRFAFREKTASHRTRSRVRGRSPYGTLGEFSRLVPSGRIRFPRAVGIVAGERRNDARNLPSSKRLRVKRRSRDHYARLPLPSGSRFAGLQACVNRFPLAELSEEPLQLHGIAERLLEGIDLLDIHFRLSSEAVQHTVEDPRDVVEEVALPELQLESHVASRYALHTELGSVQRAGDLVAHIESNDAQHDEPEDVDDHH